MNKKKDRLTFRETIVYSWRGYKIWWKAAPEVFAASGARQAVAALSPYVPLYFTARLLNEITGGGDADRVWRTLAALLASMVVVGLVQAAAVCWDHTMERSHLWPACNRVFFEKLLDMDFCDVDDPKTRTLLTRIKQNNQWSG